MSREGGRSTRPIFGYWWAAQGLKPWPCLGQKIPKINTLFTAIPSILLPCLGQWSKSTPSCFKAVHCGNCKRTNSGYSHCFCLIGVQAKFIQQIKSIVHAIPFRENHTKLYSLSVFSTEGENHTLSGARHCPTAHPCIAHVGGIPRNVMLVLFKTV